MSRTIGYIGTVKICKNIKFPPVVGSTCPPTGGKLPWLSLISPPEINKCLKTTWDSWTKPYE